MKRVEFRTGQVVYWGGSKDHPRTLRYRDGAWRIYRPNGELTTWRTHQRVDLLRYLANGTYTLKPRD